MNSKPETLEEKLVRLTLENDALITKAQHLEDVLELMHMRCDKMMERIDALKRKNSMGYD